jgi:hypothetical protein
MQDLTLHDFARDVAVVVEHEGAGPAVLVGHVPTGIPSPDRPSRRDRPGGQAVSGMSPAAVIPNRITIPIGSEFDPHH